MRVLAVAVFVVLWNPDTGSAADPFYERLLQDGIQAHDRGDPALAVKSLRLACFGLLDEPSVLARGLTFLAVAQADVGDDPGFSRTFDRILEVEQKFQAFSPLDLDADLQQTLEAHLHRLVAVDVLSRSPAFQHVARRKLEEQVHAMAPAERRRSLERLVVAEPESPTWGLLLAELQLASGEFAHVLATTERVLAGDPRLERALCLRGRAGIATGSCGQALVDLESCQELVDRTVLIEARLRCLVQLQDWPGASALLAEVPLDRQKKAPFRQLAREVRKGLKAAPRRSSPTAPTAPTQDETSDQGSVSAADLTAESGAVPTAPGSPEVAAPVPEAPVPEAPVPEAPMPDAPGPDAPMPDATVPVPDVSVPDSPEAADPMLEAPAPAASVPAASIPAASMPDASVPGIPMPETPVPEDPLTEDPATWPSELRAELERIRQLVPSGSREQLDEALVAARELAGGYRQLTEPQHLAAEIAYRLSRWQEAVTFFERGGEPSHPDRLFYFSVALFKTGDQAAARRALERCLPSLELTPFVRSFVAEILGADHGRTDPGL